MRIPLTVPPANDCRTALFRWPVRVFAVVAILTAASAADAQPAASADAYVRRDGDSWTLGTSAVRRRVTLADGKLQTTSFTDPATGHELMRPAAPAAVFSLPHRARRQANEQRSGPWKLISADTTRGKQGELQLDLAVQEGALKVTKTYVLYPGSSIIREWVAVTNAGQTPLRLSEPRFLQFAVATGDVAAQQFYWMTGAEDRPGSWVLKTLTPQAGTQNRFDAYDPFPIVAATFPGDGVDTCIELNGKTIWPVDGKEWQYLPNATVTVPFDLKADIAAGDRLAFRVNMHRNIANDTTDFDPTIAYVSGDAAGESHTAGKEFSGQQGKYGWRYQSVDGGSSHDLVYDPSRHNWHKEADNSSGTPFVDATGQHPDANQDAVRVWTAPAAGTVQDHRLSLQQRQRRQRPARHEGRQQQLRPVVRPLREGRQARRVRWLRLFRTLDQPIRHRRRQRNRRRADRCRLSPDARARRILLHPQGLRRPLSRRLGQRRQ